MFFGLAFSFSRAMENVCCLSFSFLVNHGMGIDWVGGECANEHVTRGCVLGYVTHIKWGKGKRGSGAT